MRKIKALTIRSLIKDACEEKGVPFRKAGYRRAKKRYNQLSWNRRHLVTS